MKIAKDAQGNVVSIDKVKNGLKCNCFCLDCGEALIAKNADGNKIEHHFAHRGDSSCGSLMTWLHKAMQLVLKEGNQLVLPGGELWNYSSAELEVSWNGFRIDVELKSEERAIMVEVVVTCDIEEGKRKAIVDAGRECLRFDLTAIGSEITLEKLQNIVLASEAHRSWVKEYSPQLEIPFVPGEELQEKQKVNNSNEDKKNESDLWKFFLLFFMIYAIYKWLTSQQLPSKPISNRNQSKSNRKGVNGRLS